MEIQIHDLTVEDVNNFVKQLDEPFQTVQATAIYNEQRLLVCSASHCKAGSDCFTLIMQTLYRAPLSLQVQAQFKSQAELKSYLRNTLLWFACQMDKEDINEKD